MASLAPIPPSRLDRYTAKSFTAFKVCATLGKTTPLDPIVATDLAEALNVALARGPLYHKDHLAIREDGPDGSRVHLFAIKRKSTPRWVHENHVTRAVHDLYAAPICVLDAGVIGGDL